MIKYTKYFRVWYGHDTISPTAFTTIPQISKETTKQDKDLVNFFIINKPDLHPQKRITLQMWDDETKDWSVWDGFDDTKEAIQEAADQSKTWKMIMRLVGMDTYSRCLYFNNGVTVTSIEAQSVAKRGTVRDETIRSNKTKL